MKLIDLLVKELPKRGGWPEGVEAMAQDADGAVQNYSDTIDIRINDELAHGNSRIALSYSIDSGECGIATDRLTAIITRSQYESALAENDGWIEWGGGECPVDLHSMLDVKYLGGGINKNVKAGGQMWSHARHFGDIIAYRLHKPDINSLAHDDRLGQDLKEIEVSGKYLDDIMNIPVRIDRLERDLNECIGQDVDMPEWSGDGLPPAGCECEVRFGDFSWVPCKVVYRGDAGVAFVYSDNSTIDCVGTGRDDYFRPLHTEGEKTMESAKHIIAELCRDSASNGHSADLIVEAIAAGKIPGIKLEVK